MGALKSLKYIATITTESENMLGEVFGVGIIPVTILPTCQDKETIA